ncbi:MAG: hypothetical protein J6G98_01750 [Bacilli bacterium]|nr:hypothetical protein [Bacilli bacterium]
MNYIYDIILNFNNYYYEFYDWNKSDKITEIRKIPIFKVSTNTLNDLKYNEFRLNDKFINKIKNKCEYYIGRTVKLNTSFLLTDSLDVVAFQIDKKNKYSSLQIDEELDILDELNINEINIEYELLAPNKIDNFKTRNQIYYEKNLKDELNKLFKENNESKIKYIYYECFNEKINDINLIKEKIMNDDNLNIISKKLSYLFNNKNTINN